MLVAFLWKWKSMGILTAPLHIVEPTDRLATSTPRALASLREVSDLVGIAETAAKRVTMATKNCMLKVEDELIEGVENEGSVVECGGRKRKWWEAWMNKWIEDWKWEWRIKMIADEMVCYRGSQVVLIYIIVWMYISESQNSKTLKVPQTSGEVADLPSSDRSYSQSGMRSFLLNGQEGIVRLWQEFAWALSTRHSRTGL